MPDPSAHAGAQPDRERLERDREARALRRARRKARAASGEIRELNIVAMMDMMTIILVFLLKSYQASAINVNMGADLAIPLSTTQLHPQENITVTVSMRDVAVNDRKVADLQRGRVPAAAKQGGRADALLVSGVYDALKKEVERQKTVARWNQDAPFTGRINLVADKRVPYRTLMEVLYTAGQAELGEYKFMVLKDE
jgi:biopolymer transport protein ExbD